MADLPVIVLPHPENLRGRCTLKMACFAVLLGRWIVHSTWATWPEIDTSWPRFFSLDSASLQTETCFWCHIGLVWCLHMWIIFVCFKLLYTLMVLCTDVSHVWWFPHVISPCLMASRQWSWTPNLPQETQRRDNPGGLDRWELPAALVI